MGLTLSAWRGSRGGPGACFGRALLAGLAPVHEEQKRGSGVRWRPFGERASVEGLPGCGAPEAFAGPASGGWALGDLRCRLGEVAALALTPYQEHHLKPTFERLGRWLFHPMVEASLAHVVMLAERGILDEAQARRLCQALVGLRAVQAETLAYTPDVEDIYFWIERALAHEVGPEVAADLQQARSRNDLDAAVFRMLLRTDLIHLIQTMARTGVALARQAHAMSDVVIVGYTHRQPAQPTTVGHVLAGYGEALLTQARTLAGVLPVINRSPLGACAFAGTDFPIDRNRVAELLGFSGLVHSTYESVAGADHFGLVAGGVATALSGGARFCRTLLDWLGVDKGWLTLPDAFVQVSSIMPQKRNPVVLEHLVALAGDAVGLATAVLVKSQDSFYEDTDIGTTDVQLNVRESLAIAQRFYQLLGELIAVLRVGRVPAEAEMIGQYVTTTQVADTLTALGLPFRQAHSVVSRLVKSGKTPSAWRAADLQEACQAVTGHALEAAPEELEARLREALNPFRVLERATPGGPGRQAVRELATELEAAFTDLAGRMDQEQERLTQSRRLLDQALRELGVRLEA